MSMRLKIATRMLDSASASAARDAESASQHVANMSAAVSAAKRDEKDAHAERMKLESARVCLDS